VADFGSNLIFAYNIDSESGTLTAVSGSPFPAGNGPLSVAIDPSGRFLYCANQGGGVSAFTIDATNRVLNGIAGIWSQLGDGCHPDRETWLTLEAAGFAKLAYQKVEAPSLIVSPQIVGVAVKAT
jgi:6-phosphogluconolactonase (cycloisomerase 2 family)